jgi:hypothetical protein
MQEVVQVAVANWGTALSDREVDEGIAALQTQLDRDLHSEWGVQARLFALRPVAPRAGVLGLILREGTAAAATADYEATSAGLPLAEVFLGELAKGQQWTHAASGALLRMLVDPIGPRGVYGQNGDGADAVCRLYAHEITAACAGYQHGYQIEGWQVSDFVRRAWFGEGGPVRGYDHCGRIHSVFGVLEGEEVIAYDLSRDVWLAVGARAVREVPAPTGPRLRRFACMLERARRRPKKGVGPGEDPIWGGP